MKYFITCFATLCLLPTLLASAQADGGKPAVSRSYDRELLANDCLITPHSVVDLSAPLPGLLESIIVHRSDYVEKGQLVARMASGVEQANVALAKKRALIEADVNLNRINLSYDKRQKGRIDALYQKNAVNIQHKEDADRETKISSLKLQEARDIAEIRALELRRAEEQLAMKSVISSISGFVVKRFREAGEYVEDQPILRIARLDPLYIEAVLPLSLFGKISVGMQAEIYPESGNDEPLLAHVRVVDRMGDAASGTFGLQLEMPNPDYQVPAGLKCKLKFIKTATTAQSTLKTKQSTRMNAPGNASTLATHKQTLGPLQNIEQVNALLSTLQAHAIPHQTREEFYKDFNGYMVLSQDKGPDAEMLARRKLIEAKGFSDVSLIGRANHRRLILGFFSDQEHAARHQQKLSKASITTVVKPQSISNKRWWIDIALNDSMLNDKLLLSQLAIKRQETRLVTR